MRIWGKLLGTGGAIFCYHSLTSRTLPSASTVNIPLEAFRANVRSIRRLATVIPLRDLLSRHREGKSTRGLASLTFDDAYFAISHLLGEELGRGELPITLFVATSFTEAGGCFWWDRIDDLHSMVSVPVWEEFEQEVGLPEEYRSGHGSDSSPLRPFRQWMLAEFAGRLPTHLDNALSQLELSSGRRTVHRAMTWEELGALARFPGVDFGVHTRTHPVLPLLSEAEQQEEIAGSHAVLRERFPRSIPVLAIPYGLHDRGTGRIALSCGMEASLTLAEALVPPRLHADGLVPRITANTGFRGWRVPFSTLGWLNPLVRHRRGLGQAYPALPSPTT